MPTAGEKRQKEGIICVRRGGGSSGAEKRGWRGEEHVYHGTMKKASSTCALYRRKSTCLSFCSLLHAPPVAIRESILERKKRLFSPLWAGKKNALLLFYAEKAHFI